jgi:hypothetical protein
VIKGFRASREGGQRGFKGGETKAFLQNFRDVEESRLQFYHWLGLMGFVLIGDDDRGVTRGPHDVHGLHYPVDHDDDDDDDDDDDGDSMAGRRCTSCARWFPLPWPSSSSSVPPHHNHKELGRDRLPMLMLRCLRMGERGLWLLWLLWLWLLLLLMMMMMMMILLAALLPGRGPEAINDPGES